MGRMAPTPLPRTRRLLLAYDALWSDGCSLAPFLPEGWGRKRFQNWTIGVIANDPALAREMRYICEAHDEAYYYGGTKDQRLKADKLMRTSMKEVGAPWLFRRMAFQFIRGFGGPGWKDEGISWAYGGSYFKYGVRALIQREIAPSEQAQAPKAPLYGHDLWPFNEERCDCPDDTPVRPGWVHQCSRCQQIYTRRTV